VSELAERLAAFVGDAAVRLHVCTAPEEVAAEVLPVIRDPVDLYARHPVWPSFLTDLGLPVELSVKLGGPRSAEIRCTIDVTDYQGGLRRNWSRYLAYASAVAADKGVDESDLWSLCQRALNGVPPSFASRMMHGVGFGPAGWRRGSLYFRTGWLDAPGLIRRFPAEASALAEAYRTYGSPVAGGVEVIGYDFAPAAPLRSKAYAWVLVDEGATFADAVGSHPDLAPAQVLFDAHRPDGAALPERSLALQTSFDADLHQRLVFLSPAWGWTGPTEQEQLLRFLGRELGIDETPIEECSDAAAEHGFGLSLALVAVGTEDGAPSAGFYLWPSPLAEPRGPSRLGKEHRPARLTADARSAIEGGTEYLRSMRQDDGWDDYELEAGDEESSRRFVTAHVEAMLSGEDGPCAELAVVESDGASVDGSLDALLARQAPDGSWSSPWWADDFVPTWHALLGLRASAGGEPTDDEARVLASRSRALLFLRSAAVPAEPLGLASWLGGWIAAAGPLEPRIVRAAEALIELQQPAGHWLGAPSRRLGQGTYVDNRCLVTTAAAVGSLRALLVRLEEPVGAGAQTSTG
jgi:hypothetical protein